MIILMALISDGISEIGADVRGDLGYLICWRHLFRYKGSHKSKISFKKDLYSYIREKHVLS